ncbi:MAG: DUF2336 domain-containing protein [Rhodospirillaceae bacterium]
MLYYLASDLRPEVRREISSNPATPRQADLLLSEDRDVAVRSGLARKIARIAPDLSSERQHQIERLTLQVLERLARDQATEVRQILSEQLNSVASAPPSVINLLARDVEQSVSAPVLRNSPILSEDDLLEIVFGGPGGGALAAIAERDRVSPLVSDAIATSNDVNAITVLLKNPSAQIREETLDRIIDRAPEHEVWHEPLVCRPKLPPRAAARLACFVADSLLQALKARTDLGPTASRQIAETVKARLGYLSAKVGNDIFSAEIAAGKAAEPGKPVAKGKEGAKGAGKVEESPTDRAKRLKQDGKLDESVVAAALTNGERDFVIAMLAELAETNITNVERVLAGHSARGTTALVWRAGLSMKLARQVQLRLAQIPPKQVVNPLNGIDYPLSEEDMRWQLEFFGII